MPTALKPARYANLRCGGRDGLRVQLAEVRLRREPREREVPPLVGARCADRDAGVGWRARDPGSAFARHGHGDRDRVGMKLVAEHKRSARPDHVELLAGDVGDRRTEPASVLEPDGRQHLHR